MRRLACVLTIVLCLAPLTARAGVPWEQRSLGMRALLTSVAVAADVMPGLSAIYAKQCLPGYIVCKTVFAIGSLMFATEQFAFSGGNDTGQTKAILYRGFEGDWFLNGRHVNGDTTPQPWPDPPSTRTASGDFPR